MLCKLLHRITLLSSSRLKISPSRRVGRFLSSAAMTDALQVLEPTGTALGGVGFASASRAPVNPALLYLSELGSDTARRTMRSKLNRAARLAGASDLEHCAWQQMRHQDVHAILLSLEKEGLAASTINNYLAALKGVALEAWKQDLMSAEQLARIKAIKSRRSYRLPKGRCLSREETKAILSANRGETPIVDCRDKALLALMIGCGLRRAEICDLVLEAYDPEQSAITLVGKGNKERRVYLPESAEAFLKTWLSKRGLLPGFLFTRIFRGGHILVNRPLSLSAITFILKDRIHEAGLAPATPHDLRRTFATRLIESGHDLVLVQRAMGHANIQTTARYDRRGDAEQKALAKQVEL